MIPELNATEARVLACLVEKEVTTPDYYPMTLHALTTACNQKSCRDPVVAFAEEDVTAALENLRDKQWVSLYAGADSRGLKYRQRLTERISFTPQERAIICELLLRGPQTPGELRNRAERMAPIESPAEVEALLKDLTERPDGPWVAPLPRQPGMKEIRYAQLMTGPVSERPASSAPATTAIPRSALAEKVEELGRETQALRQELAALRDEFSAFRKQFD